MYYHLYQHHHDKVIIIIRYGPDLMLISTVFGSTKTPAQLRQKLKVEGKRNPNRLNKALESRKTISL